jgi:ATP-dependent Clp protease ATP-binding subunit ClpA
LLQDKYRGQFEEAHESAVMNELEKMMIYSFRRNHTIVGAGGATVPRCIQYVKPALARGEIQCIEQTLDEYRPMRKDSLETFPKKDCRTNIC